VDHPDFHALGRLKRLQIGNAIVRHGLPPPEQPFRAYSGLKERNVLPLLP
jgi:hypothetical protein